MRSLRSEHHQHLAAFHPRMGLDLGHVGGLFLHQSCRFEMLGSGVDASKELKRTRTRWFEGALLPLPDSQQQEDYPKDMAGRVRIAADAPLGFRYGRAWTSQGATPALKFVVGDLPEVPVVGADRHLQEPTVIVRDR